MEVLKILIATGKEYTIQNSEFLSDDLDSNSENLKYGKRMKKEIHYISSLTPF